MSYSLIIFLSTFAGLAVIGIPLAFTAGVASVIYFIVSDRSITMVAQGFLNGLSSFVMLAIPLFIFASHVMTATSITNRIISLSNLLVGRWPGGLAQVNVLSSMFFGGCSGSALADVAGIGSVMMAAMRKNGYKAEFSAAVTVCSSLQGPLIPPSIPLVVYASVAQVSPGAMLVGGAIPGVLLGLSQMATVFFIARRRGYGIVPRGDESAFRVIVSSVPAILMPVILLGGIISGVFTPTEASAVSVAYALMVGFFVYGDLTLGSLASICLKVARDSATIFYLIGTAGIFSWILSVEQVPNLIVNLVTEYSINTVVLLISINFILLAWGMFLDAGPALLILGPLLVKVTTAAGIDPVHFGVVMVFNLLIGLMTPPYGLCLFSAATIVRRPIGAVFRELRPFIAGSVIVLVLLTYIPWLVLELPRLAGFIK